MGIGRLATAVTVGIAGVFLLYSFEKEEDEFKRIMQSPFDAEMAQGQNLTAFVLGGTGAVGRDIIKALAGMPQFTRVTLIGRRQVPLPGPDEDARYDKFDEKIIDFDKVEEYADAFKGYDAGFSSLGTTRAKSGAEGFYKVDFHYVVNTAKLAKLGGCKHFSLVSSAGSNKNAFFLYPKTKGEAEEAVKALGFERLTIYRPGLLLTDNREEVRIGEACARKIIKPLDFRRWLSVDVPLLAKVIVANSFRKPGDDSGVEVLDNKAINALGKALPESFFK